MDTPHNDQEPSSILSMEKRGRSSNFISDKRHFTPQVAISYPHMSALGHMTFIIYHILIISKWYKKINYLYLHEYMLEIKYWYKLLSRYLKSNYVSKIDHYKEAIKKSNLHICVKYSGLRV